MKSLTRAIAIASLATVATAAQAELSSTVGAVTDYVFRGEGLAGAGAYASVDFEEAGFYAGVWAINDANGGGGANDGLETDYYFGYGFEQDDLSLGLGYTRYEYSYKSNFEHEINLSAGFAGFGLNVALGRIDTEAFDVSSTQAKDDEQDYTVITLGYSTDTYGILVGSKDIDESDEKQTGESEYKWVELSASKEVNGFDFTLLLGRQFDAESTSTATATPPNTTTKPSSYGTEYLVLDVSKSFDL